MFLSFDFLTWDGVGVDGRCGFCLFVVRFCHYYYYHVELLCVCVCVQMQCGVGISRWAIYSTVFLLLGLGFGFVMLVVLWNCGYPRGNGLAPISGL